MIGSADVVEERAAEFEIRELKNLRDKTLNYDITNTKIIISVTTRFIEHQYTYIRYSKWADGVFLITFFQKHKKVFQCWYNHNKNAYIA